MIDQGEIDNLRGKVEILQAQVEGLHTAAAVFREQRDQANAERLKLAIEVERLRWLAVLLSDE